LVPILENLMQSGPFS